MLPVTDALSRIFDLVTPAATEEIGLAEAAGRVLAEPAIARRDQPPFAASSMDGYALRKIDARATKPLTVIGTSAAGHGFHGNVARGQTVRIFTGAPVPEGADFVVIQEDVSRTGDRITIAADPEKSDNIRPKGGDFVAGDTLDAPRRLSASDVALLAAMNIPHVTVTRRPTVALIATGDELVMPGEAPGPDQIIASNSFGLAALVRAAGAQARLLPIARDSPASLKTAFSLAADADLVVTIGGASVGDHDIVGDVTEQLGLTRAFFKIAMRPGKPLMAGRLGNAIHLGLPGNPVSSMVCGHIFMLPLLRAMSGLPAESAPRLTARLSGTLAKNGPREHYMRAQVSGQVIAPFTQQDSAMLGILSRANALLIRPVNSPAASGGDLVDYVPI